MKLGKHISMAIAAIALAGAGVAQANVTSTTIDSPEVDIPAIGAFKTTGANMDGLAVTAVFGDTRETIYWSGSATSSTAGGVSGTGWSLKLDGDSYDTTWVFAFSPDPGRTLTGLILDGSAADTIFDRTLPDKGTNGSEEGTDFWLVNESIAASAIYSNQVKLIGQQPLGDVWYTLTVGFTQGISSGFEFQMDTDKVNRDIPEPATLGLLVLALAGAGFSMRRRKAAQSSR